MELKSAAEQILFGESLDDKFTRMSGLSDSPHPALTQTPQAPGRPVDLMMTSTQGRHQFPTLVKLENDLLARGHVMHFLANHELLALELMALALLRFPDAPSGFRQMIAHTMEEEQEHLRLYIDRMESFGVGFGELKLNDFFWKIISKMQSPLDYVSWMSMTFEQANLDFSKHYQELFHTLGDRQSSDLMKVVYEDEIGHLGGGVRWFKKFSQAESLWKTWTHHLHGHMNIVRAKGKPFDVEGRIKAGLDQEYIENIWLYQKSRGKRPALGVWNTGTELEMSGAQFKGKALHLKSDLSSMAFHMVSQDDAVLVHAHPNRQWLNWMKVHGFNLPELVVDSELKLQPSRAQEYSRVLPWAMSPNIQTNYIEPLGLAQQDLISTDQWSVQNSKWGWKSFLAEALHGDAFQNFQRKYPDLLDPQLMKDLILIQDVDFYLESLQHLQAQGVKRLVIQAEFSVSGHHLKMVDVEEADNPSLIRWVESILAQSKRIVLEPFRGDQNNLNLSFLYGQHQQKILGQTLFEVHGGKYTGHWIGPVAHQMNSQQRLQILPALKDLQVLLQSLARKWMGDLEMPCGIDLLVYQDQGRWKIYPGLEINPRWTMGHIALQISKRVPSNISGRWTTQAISKVSDLEVLWEQQLKSTSLAASTRSLAPGKFILNDLSHSKTWVSILELKFNSDWGFREA